VNILRMSTNESATTPDVKATEMKVEAEQKNKGLVRLGRQLHESTAAKESAQAKSETKDRTIDRLQRDLSSAQHNVERLDENVQLQGATSQQQ
jgi:predicted RNase H-like nuclease (RuvC/YqgF family)